jgi:hypothetical protein
MSAIQKAGRERTQRTIADPCITARLELVRERRELIVVEALAGDVGALERDAELGVDGLEVTRRQIDQDPPVLQRLRIARLQQDDARTRAIRERRITLELLARGLVELRELGDLGVRRPQIDHVLDQHAERRAPVTDVVLAQDGVAAPFEHARERIADHRAAQVADVHLLRDVRVRVVDHDTLGCGGHLHAEAFAAVRDRGRRTQPLGAQPDVEEARIGDLDPGDDLVDRKRGDDRFCDRSRRALDLLREPHREIRL